MQPHPAESKRKKGIERRMKKVFPEQWAHLTEEKRQTAVEAFYKKAWLDRVTAGETLENIRDMGVTFGVVFLGVILAVLGGLFVNIIDRLFVVYGIWYQISIPILFFAVLFWLNRLFEERINQEYKDNNFLEELFKEE